MKRSEWIDHLHDKLDELDLRIGELQASAGDKKAIARRELDERIAALKEKREAARSKVLEVRDAGEAAWDQLGDGAQKVWQEVEETLRQTKRAFTED